MAIILGIESSCDDTAVAVCQNGQVLSNVVANQHVHAAYGGVVPELASRAHLEHIVPTVDTALKHAGISLTDLDAIAVTQGPGLLGSLVVGFCYAKGLASGLQVPLIGVDHLEAHALSCFADDLKPDYPFLCLTVSGGHSRLTIVHDAANMEVIGKTRDDAAGEAFDKIGKLMGLDYPAGPLIDRLAQGATSKFTFTKADIPNLDFSFSGLKTQVMYFLRDQMRLEPQFMEQNKSIIAASVQRTIIDMLMDKLDAATKSTGLTSIAIVGGVSANSELRNRAKEWSQSHNLELFIPGLAYCTDNGAMVAVAGYEKFKQGTFTSIDASPYARSKN